LGNVQYTLIDGAPGWYLVGKAPYQVAPGIRTAEGVYANDLGRLEPWRAHYDQYGRLVARTDFNAGNQAQGIPDIHYHTYRWGRGETPSEIESHVPGVYEPEDIQWFDTFFEI
jgi:hypothetical protein